MSVGADELIGIARLANYLPGVDGFYRPINRDKYSRMAASDA